MEREFHSVTNAIDVMDRIQARHLESFQAELLPDLERHTLERTEAFERLTSCLTLFFNQIQMSDEAQASPMVETITEQITRLQQQNQMLVEKVETYKADLQARMRGLTKGRQAMKSYGPPSSFSKRPRVISLTN